MTVGSLSARSGAVSGSTSDRSRGGPPIRTTCCIVGGGPAGAILALLLARQGIDVTLLESHDTLDRDFRGDTLHPSTLELMQQLGLVDRLLQIPHSIERQRVLHSRGRIVPVWDWSQLNTSYPYLVLLPQVRFLEFVLAEAARYPSFHLHMRARVDRLIEEAGVIRGVAFRRGDDVQEVHAVLTIGADGRLSKIRQLAGFGLVSTAQPMDVLWFRLPRDARDAPEAGGIYVGNGSAMVLLDRGSEWQIAYLFPKGGYARLRQAGLDALRRAIAKQAPWLEGRTADLQQWTQTSVLSIESGYARRWYRPGLLLIGDAAHVMSPVGGVGINFAIQDAVAAANVLGPRLNAGRVSERDLAVVQRRRARVARLGQGFQALSQHQQLAGGSVSLRVLLASRLVQRLPVLRNLRTQVFAFGGFRPEKLRR